MFALYGLFTRFAARKDSTTTSFFWSGASGAVVLTVAGIWFWEPMTAGDWQWMAVLCVTGAGGHWLQASSSAQCFVWLLRSGRVGVLLTSSQ